MTRDIKLGMEITRGKDYGHLSERDKALVFRKSNGLVTIGGYIVKFAKDGIEK